ncbi:quinate utilization oxidoreductase QutH [Pseudohyphozyma bogoriensis]|nr:quinate utilization oxidoreductase QutH [Pseudohyphozyma bogoriensis]
MTRPLNLRLIGRRHTEHVIDEPEAELSCIVDPTPSGPAFAEKHSVKLFKSLEEVLEARKKGEVKVDGCILATPNATHVPLGIQCLEEGLHVLVEKPMSTDIPTGKQLLDAEAKSSTKVLVGQHRRWNPYIVNLKTMLDSGALGKILAVSGLWTTLKPQDYYEGATEWRKAPNTGGTILINLVHDIDLMIYLFGDIVRVYCEEGVSTRGHPVEETGALTMKFASGTVGTFIFSDATASPYNLESATGENPIFPKASQNCYTIMGTHGSTAFPELRRFSYSPAPGSWTDTFSPIDPIPVEDVPPFTKQLKNFVKMCKGEEEPNCSGLQALKTIITLEAVKESIKSGKPVDVEVPK